MMNEIRVELVRFATEELWAKIGDMQAGTPLSKAEWAAVLDRIQKWLERERGDWIGSLEERN